MKPIRQFKGKKKSGRITVDPREKGGFLKEPKISKPSKPGRVTIMPVKKPKVK